MTPTLDVALLCSSRAGSDLGLLFVAVVVDVIAYPEQFIVIQ